MQAPNLSLAGGQQQVNMAALQAAGAQLVRLPNGQVGVVPNAANNPMFQQQLALLQGMNPQAQAQAALLAGARGLPLNVNPLALQQQQRALQGAAGASALAHQQQQLLALQQRQHQHQALAGAAAAAARPALQQVATQPLPNTTANFTPDQLETLKEQIVAFKKHKKGAEKVTPEELAKCKPKPLPTALQPRASQAVVPPAAAVAGAAGAAVRPAAAAGLAMQGMRPQLSTGVAALAASHQQQQQLRAAAAAANLGGRGALGAAGAAAGRGVQQQGRPGADGAASAKAEPPPGPSHPPMEEPVRRPAGPVLSMVPATEAQGGWGLALQDNASVLLSCHCVH